MIVEQGKRFCQAKLYEPDRLPMLFQPISERFSKAGQAHVGDLLAFITLLCCWPVLWNIMDFKCACKSAFRRSVPYFRRQ